MLKLYHISYFYIPVIGFVIAITVGIVTSLIIGKFFGNFKFIRSRGFFKNYLFKALIYLKIIFELQK